MKKKLRISNHFWNNNLTSQEISRVHNNNKKIIKQTLVHLILFFNRVPDLKRIVTNNNLHILIYQKLHVNKVQIKKFTN